MNSNRLLPDQNFHLHRVAVHFLPRVEADSDDLRGDAERERHRARRLAVVHSALRAHLAPAHHFQLGRQLPHLPHTVN